MAEPARKLVPNAHGFAMRGELLRALQIPKGHLVGVRFQWMPAPGLSLSGSVESVDFSPRGAESPSGGCPDPYDESIDLRRRYRPFLHAECSPVAQAMRGNTQKDRFCSRQNPANRNNQQPDARSQRGLVHAVLPNARHTRALSASTTTVKQLHQGTQCRWQTEPPLSPVQM